MGERIEEGILFLFRYANPWGTNERMKAVDRLLDPMKARIDARDHYNEQP